MKMIIFAIAAILALALAAVVDLFADATGIGKPAARKVELYGKAFAEIARAHMQNHMAASGMQLGILTLNGLIPTIYEAMDVVSRELVGFIPAVSRDSSAERAAVGQVVMSPVVGALPAEDLVAAAFAPMAPDRPIGNVQMTIAKARSVPFGITGEETKGLQNAGTLGTINRDSIVQAFRTLTNEVETDLAALHIYASRAYGTAATTPFGIASDLSDFAQSRKILDDNGVPQSDLHMVLGSSAVANIRGKQTGLFRVNEAGTDDLLRRGALGEVEGFDLHNSAQVKKTVTAGTAAGATTNATGYSVGATVITIASAGTGAVIAGDILTVAGDTEKYVIVSGDTDVSNGGVLTIAEPGLQKAIPAAATALTLVAATTRNMFFHRSAIQLATRAPAMPEGGDSADDVVLITDPYSGLTYEFCLYRGKRSVRWEVNLAWGVKAVAPRHIGLLIGA
ncbi:P22 coat - protein 5 family protein [Pseudoduganella sp. FT26W]|uniref:P22 coat-protein 5 family protein n=2 Tax=Duganella aquatilis TaxID=2666082 RepID=A0A844CRI8_9BURK|nr:P22 coat - protein 5 family protein [Duganella aquatilis]